MIEIVEVLLFVVQVYRGSDVGCKLNDLKADQVYQFRVQAVRILSDVACQDTPSTSRDIKGIYSPVIRLRTLSEPSVKQEYDDELNEGLEEEKEEMRRISDTQIAILILGSFLGICILTVIILRGIISDQ